MKQKLVIICTLLLMLFAGVPINHGFATPVAEKKAILVVSNGSSQSEVIKQDIEGVEKSIKDAYPDYEVRRAFTSQAMIDQLMERDGVKVDNETEALARLQADGYNQVVVQPLMITAGEDYSKVRDAVAHDQSSSAFDKIVLGRPLMDYAGQDGKADDYLAAVFVVKAPFPKLACCNAIVLVGHDGAHPDNDAYATLQQRIDDAGFGNVYVCTVDGKPSLNNVLERIKSKKFKKITVVPFTLVAAGKDATNDVSLRDIEAARSKLTRAGFNVETYAHGLGENFDVQQIFVQHVKDAIEMLSATSSK